MILFYDIFERAFNLFDDPDISKKYYEDQAGFQHDMLDYLMLGKNKFTYPVIITDQLADFEPAIGYSESEYIDPEDEIYNEYVATNIFVLEREVANKGVGVGFTYRINGKQVSAKYDAETNSVIFDHVVKKGDTWYVSWFYAGAFKADFNTLLNSDFPGQAICDKIINILAYALLSAWGDKEVGRVLEVRNILTDTDFQMYSPANSAKAKMEWRNQMNKDMDTLVSELNWRIMSTPKGGSNFGR